MDSKELNAMEALGAKFREERKQKSRKATPRNQQTVTQLAATWRNPANGIVTRIDAYQLWHAKENDGELKEPEGVIALLKVYDGKPVKT